MRGGNPGVRPALLHGFGTREAPARGQGGRRAGISTSLESSGLCQDNLFFTDYFYLMLSRPYLDCVDGTTVSAENKVTWRKTVFGI